MSGSAPEKSPGSSLGAAAAKSHIRECRQQHPPAKGENSPPRVTAVPHINNREHGGGGRRTERKGEKWLTVMKSINHAVINNLIILENCGFFLTKKHLNTTAVNNPTLYPYF